MKTKIIAVIVALNASFCTGLIAQGNVNTMHGNKGSSGNGTATPAPAPATIPTNTNAVQKPAQLNLNGNLLTQQNLQIVLNQVAKSKEYQNLKKNVTTKVNNSKVGKKVSGFTRFLQNIGLAKKPIVPKKTTK